MKCPVIALTPFKLNMKIIHSIGDNIINLETVDSTNNYLKELLKVETPQEGTVIITQEQTAGRGQVGNCWESNKGENVTLSFVIYPTFIDARNQFMISKVISLGIVDFLKTFITDVKIKWPNDIYVNEKKIAGVLIENTLIGNSISSSIAGIGLNINQKTFSPALPNPTSLSLETGDTYQLEELYETLFSKLNYWYNKLKTSKVDDIDIEYLFLLYRYQKLHQYKVGDEVFTAKIIDIDQFGRLCLLNEKKELLQFAFKEVVFL